MDTFIRQNNFKLFFSLGSDGAVVHLHQQRTFTSIVSDRKCLSVFVFELFQPVMGTGTDLFLLFFYLFSFSLNFKRNFFIFNL